MAGAIIIIITPMIYRKIIISGESCNMKKCTFCVNTFTW